MNDRQQIDEVRRRLITDDDLRSLTIVVPANVLRIRFEQVGYDWDRLATDCRNVRVVRDGVSDEYANPYGRGVMAFSVHWPDGCVYRDAWFEKQNHD